jgi:hypothetical protein
VRQCRLRAAIVAWTKVKKSWRRLESRVAVVDLGQSAAVGWGLMVLKHVVCFTLPIEDSRRRSGICTADPEFALEGKRVALNVNSRPLTREKETHTPTFARAMAVLSCLSAAAIRVRRMQFSCWKLNSASLLLEILERFA